MHYCIPFPSVYILVPHYSLIYYFYCIFVVILYFNTFSLHHLPFLFTSQLQKTLFSHIFWAFQTHNDIWYLLIFNQCFQIHITTTCLTFFLLSSTHIIWSSLAKSSPFITHPLFAAPLALIKTHPPPLHISFASILRNLLTVTPRKQCNSICF